jgi:hypothetical protein
VVGVHVQVHVDQRPALQVLAQRAVRAPVVAAGGNTAVERVDLVGDHVPRAGRPGGAVASEQVGLLEHAGELGHEDLEVAGLEEQAALAVVEQLLVQRQAGRDRNRLRRDRALQQRRGRVDAGGGEDHDVGVVEHVGLVAGAEAHALGQVAAQQRLRAPLLGDQRGPPRRGHRQPAQRAQEQALGRPLLVGDEGDLERPGARVRRRRGRARAHELVRRREPTRHELARGRPRRRAGVQAAEEQLHHAARDLRGDEPLGGGVERADVQRPRVAQRRRGHAGRERLMHVHEVEGDAVQQLLDRARDVDRHRGGPARRTEGQHLAHADHLHPVQRHLARAHGAPRGVHEVERVRGCDDRDLVPALHEPLRGLADEAVDLVAVLPGVRRDLRDAESGHRPEG